MTDTPDSPNQETEKEAPDSNQGPAIADERAGDQPVADTKDKKSEESFATLGRIKILCNSELTQYSKKEIKAYDAVSTKAKGARYIAYICERHLTPRMNDIEVYDSIVNPTLLRIVSKGVVYWPPAKEERFVIIYQKVLGDPLLQRGKPNALGLKQEIVVEHILKPLVGAFIDFKNKEFVHGAIRAGNFYNSSSNSSKNVILGDCLTAPHGYEQSVLYETIPRAMCDPIARGQGTVEDDIYALGVSIAILMRTSDFHVNMSSEEIIRRKIEDGSYAAITGTDRFTGSILEFLRGVLHDEPEQRWTIDDIQAWLDGIRLSPKQTRREKKAPRPFELGGQKFFYLSSLAMELDTYPHEVVRIIEDDSLCQWIERSLEAPLIVERVKEVAAKASAQGTGKGYVDRLVSYLSVGLDENSPLRFGYMRLHGEGVGAALTEAIVRKADLNIFSDLFLKEAIFFWLSAQGSKAIDFGKLVQKFDKCKRALMQAGIGQGIERCAYILNPQSHCMSPRFDGFLILKPEDFLRVLEEQAREKKKIELPIDRHVAAFLIEHDSKIIDPVIYDLNSGEQHRIVIGNLKVLAAMQKRYKSPNTPHLAKAFAPYFSSIYKRIHDKSTREKLKLNVDKTIKKGDLSALLQQLDNRELQKHDFNDFMQAYEGYKSLEDELFEIEEGMKDRASYQRPLAAKIGAMIACAISGVIIMAIAMTYF